MPGAKPREPKKRQTGPESESRKKDGVEVGESKPPNVHVSGGSRRTLTAKDVTPGAEIDPSAVNVFRGGSSLRLKPGEAKVDKATGLVKTTHGPSLDVDAAAMDKFGGAHRIDSVPTDLRILQRGKNLGHFEVVPREAMTQERFQELIGQIKMSPTGK